MDSLSLLVLTRNEEKIVGENLIQIHSYLSNLKEIKDFEILVCDYSVDKTPQLVANLSKDFSSIHYVEVKRKGIGAGLKAGIDRASKEFSMFYPIDMSWSLSVIKDSIEAAKRGNDVVLGSRFCKGSIVKRPIARNLFSFFYNSLVWLLFGLKIKDTQGTILFNIKRVKSFRSKLESDDPFLQTEILIYAKNNNLRIIEIPCEVIDYREESKINPIIIGSNMFYRLLTKKLKFLLKNN